MPHGVAGPARMWAVGLGPEPLFQEARATADQPDDHPGAQVHVMYVVPADGSDERLDLHGTIAGSVASFQAWFAAQSGGRRLRLDTFQGGLDITFVRLRESDARIRSSHQFVRDRIQEELISAGFVDPSKLYAVYYGGSSSFSCGGAAWPPELVGNVAAVYLKGEPPGARPCATNRVRRADEQPGYWEFSMLHEIVHTLGAAATCAPHHTLAGHVSDDPRDLMYAGPLPWLSELLDVGRDDYYGHGRSNCLDVARSAFLEPSEADAELPPGWAEFQQRMAPGSQEQSDLQAQDCGFEGAARSRDSETETTLVFVNQTRQAFQLFWLDFTGRRQFFAGLSPGQALTQRTFLTHPWLVADQLGQCVGIFLPVDRPARAVIRP